MDDSRTAVVGAGFIGPVVVQHLADNGAGVTVVGRHDDAGGWVRIRTEDGFTLDRGPQVLFTDCPAVWRELGLDVLDLWRFTPGATIYRLSRRVMLSDPLRDVGNPFGSVRNPEMTTSDKLRMLAFK